MQCSDSSFTTLRRLANQLGLPARWLKAEAVAGRIPYLRVGRSLRFNPEHVERVLADRATTNQSTNPEAIHA